MALTGSVAMAQGAGTMQTPQPVAPASAGAALPDNPLPNSNRVKSGEQPLDTTPGQSSSASTQPLVLGYASAGSHVTVLENTLIRVLINQPLSSRQAKDGTPVSFTLNDDVVVDNAIVIPRGVAVHGEVVRTKKAGALSGSPELTLKLVSLDMGGQSYPLYTYQFRVQGASKTKPTETKVKGGAVIGAIVGGVFSGSAKGETTATGKLAGMGTGAALGAGVGTVASAATPGPVLTIPAESQMDFYLASPISVLPLDPKEAARLAQRVHPGAPVLYVRGSTP